jgi:UDP-glucose 4-epimerase
MRGLFTGGAGFIGSHMAERLQVEGHQVTVLDNESTGKRENVPTGVRYIKGDVTEKEDMTRAFGDGLDAVFHIAGQGSTIRSFGDPSDDLRTNVQGTISVLQHCLDFKIGRLLYASSMTVYGHPDRLPIAVTDPLEPVSYYGISKLAAERYVHSTAARNDLDFDLHVTSFRMFNVYGERQSLTNPYQGVVAIFIGNVLRDEPITIFGDGEQSRDFVYISDVVEAWMLALDNPASYDRVFNVGLGVRQSLLQVVDTLLEAEEKSRRSYPVQFDVERPGDQRHMQADISDTREVLDWEPKVGFAEGMARTITWARKTVGSSP